MKPLSANAAAKMAGKAKGTILKDLDNGTLSGTKNDKGQWEIAPSELARVYDFEPPDQSGNQSTRPPMTAPTDHENRLEIERLRAALEGAEARLGDMRETVADLRTRLDEERADRRAAQARLEDLRDKAEGQGPAAPVAAPVAAPDAGSPPIATASFVESMSAPVTVTAWGDGIEPPPAPATVPNAEKRGSWFGRITQRIKG